MNNDDKKTLYLMMGRPGSGKTTAAKAIQEVTGATHMWADKIRRERYGRPTYDHSENLALYDHMNRMADELLAAGNNVIFDTNFNHYKDRLKLRNIADDHDAKTLVVWVDTSKEIAKTRATKNAHMQDNRLLGDMSDEDFERLSHNLEKPKENEDFIKIDGTKISADYIRSQLGL